MFLLILLISISFFGSTLAATADQWRGRSIYQSVLPPMFYADYVSVSLNSVPRVITDRYALPKGADANACNVTARTWCGGTWRTIQDNLDYIQSAGFTASEFIPLLKARISPFYPPSSLDQSRLSEL